MRTNVSRAVARSLVAAAAAMLGACAPDSPLAPDRAAAPIAAAAHVVGRGPDLGTCDSLQAPAGHTLAFRAYAKGVQIYRWTGTQWGFVAPEATLYADPRFTGEVGSHYAGPTWESVSGSTVVAAVDKRCPSEAGAIAWLLLGAVADAGPGLFDGTTFIQRINTAGGNAPTAPGSAVGVEARIPYAAEYYFYRAQ